MVERPKGTNDYIHPESSLRKIIVEKISNFFEILGYKPIETPIFESVDLFKRSAGVVSDIVSKEMYEFQDKKGRHLALRPEITAPVVRAIIQNNLLQQQIIKLYYVGSIFRYEKPQKDRYRQATQFGVEYLGIENYIADFELIFSIYKLYQSFNLDVEIHVNSIGCKDCRPQYRQKLYEYFSKHKENLCNDCQRRLEENPLRILDCKNPNCKLISKEAPKSIEYLCQNCDKHHKELTNILKFYNVPLIENHYLVRGLDYYNRTVFEVKFEGVDLAGGGRYDYLVNQISEGKYDMPAIGFAGGLERLTNILKEKQNINKFLGENIKINLVSLTNEADKIITGIYTRIINKIAGKKNSIEVNLMKFEKLSKALKIADKMKANYTLFMGEEEIKEDEITIKNMETGKQEKIKVENFMIKFFEEIINIE